MQHMTITIKTTNAAFEDNETFEIARILRHLADRAESGFTLSGQLVRDCNGNSVGVVIIKH